MTNGGPLGWVTDRLNGYRYQKTHPETGQAWPPIPSLALRAWSELGRYPFPPEACLVNFYAGSAHMGLHQDRDEQDLQAPVVSLSLGDTCIFRFGGTKRSEPTRTLQLKSGDALVLGGAARLAFHGVDRILPGSSSLLSGGGRSNLTLRRVTEATNAG
jgi:alkylated DNA repair protein (DNA oxidative demethylase)